MKITHALLPLAAAMAIAGCGSRGTAQSVVGQAEGMLSPKREEAALIAPAELKSTETTLAHMKQNFEDREYKAVIGEVPRFNQQLATLKEAMSAGQEANAAATQEWSTLNEQVNKSVDELQARVDSLKPEALPKDVTKEALATAKVDFEALKSTWAEATAAASSSKTVDAVEKGRVVQVKAEELKIQLGMNPTLASAG